MKVVVLLEVRDLESFRDYETRAVRIMREYSGSLVSAFRPDVEHSSGDEFHEVHILEFPSINEFRRYRSDAALAELPQLRSKAIASTKLYVSGEAVTYDAA